MDDKLTTIRNWANHGTISQFKNEVMAKVGDQGYEAEATGKAVTFFRVTKQGGFLGIGAKKVRTAVLTVTRDGADVRVPAASADAEFVDLLLSTLLSH